MPRTKASRPLQPLNRWSLRSPWALATIGLTVLVGIVVIVLVFASTKPQVVEPENGFLSGPVSVVCDPTAANGREVTFGTTAQSAPTCGSPSTSVSSRPSVVPSASVSPSTRPSTSPSPATYCGGKTPCYGPRDLAAHAQPGSCWGYNRDVVIDLTAWAPAHPGGPNVVENSTICGQDLSSFLSGQKSSNGQTHTHSSGTQNNTNAQLNSYKVGTYDAMKP